jgi:hypothetical protein
MIPINIVVEDNLSEAMLKTILNQSGKNFVVVRRYPDLRRTHSSSGFGYIKTKIEGFNKAARGTPFLVLTDLDNHGYRDQGIRTLYFASPNGKWNPG